MADVRGKPGIVPRLSLKVGPRGDLVFERDKGAFTGGQNLPVLSGAAISPGTEHIQLLKDGFAQVYRSLLSHHASFLGLLDGASGCAVRLLYRNTIAYRHLLDEALHPALLLSENAMASHFSRLDTGGSASARDLQLLAYETECLQRRDVPFFLAKTDQRNLLLEEGSMPDYFAQTGLDVVRATVGSLDARDLDRQLWTIDSAFRVKRNAHRPAPTPSLGSSAGPAKRGLREAYLGHAITLTDAIVGQIHQNDIHASWLVLKGGQGDGPQTLASALYDLYAGMPGEILLLYEAHRAGLGDHREVARKAIRFLIREAHLQWGTVRSLGLFAGWGSLLKLSAELWRLDPEIAPDLDAVIRDRDFAALVDDDRGLSVIHGSAGLVIAAVDHAASSKSDWALRIARRAADHLVARRTTTGRGAGWQLVSEKPLSGLAHGSSGFAVAFAKLFAVTGSDADRQMCMSALEYEHSLFSPEHRNWLDLRDTTRKVGGPPCAMTWAHGAPGIGLARLAILQSGIDTPEIRADLKVAVESALALPLTGETPLISGDLGRLELPIRYAESIGDDYWQETIRRLGAVSQMLERQIPFVTRRNIPALGLMTGVTGVAYQCLRLAYNECTPPLLSLSSTSGAALPWSVSRQRLAIRT